MHIRPYRPDDEDAVIELMAEQPDFHESPADRAVLRLDHRLQLVAAQDEHVAACGALLCPPWFDVSQLQASVVVTAARRNEGVGSAMWQQILMSTGSAKTVHGSVAVDDKRSLAIARHWGLSVYQTPITTVITLDQRPDSVALADGLWIEYFDDIRNLGRTDLDRLLIEADTSPEAGETGTHGLAGFDSTPSPVMGVVLHDADKPVGLVFTLLEESSGHVLLTAIHPDHRGRGLARVIKQAAHRAAYDLGVRRLTTSNESSNTAIRALNESMGYKQLAAYHRVRRMV